MRISKINSTLIDDAKDLDMAMQMYDLLEYSNNYSMASGSLLNYYSDEVKDNVNEDKENYWINNEKITAS